MHKDLAHLANAQKILWFWQALELGHTDAWETWKLSHNALKRLKAAPNAFIFNKNCCSAWSWGSYVKLWVIRTTALAFEEERVPALHAGQWIILLTPIKSNSPKPVSDCRVSFSAPSCSWSNHLYGVMLFTFTSKARPNSAWLQEGKVFNKLPLQTFPRFAKPGNKWHLWCRKTTCFLKGFSTVTGTVFLL